MIDRRLESSSNASLLNQNVHLYQVRERIKATSGRIVVRSRIERKSVYCTFLNLYLKVLSLKEVDKELLDFKLLELL